MNKQFLSLLLLTSFVGQTMPAAFVAKSISQLRILWAGPTVVPAVKLSKFAELGVKVSALMKPVNGFVTGTASKLGAKIAGLGEASQTAVVATGLGAAGVATGTALNHQLSESSVGVLANMGSAFGKSGYVSIHDAVSAANYAARPWYVKAGSVIADSASIAKASTIAAGKAAVEFAKVNKGKTAAITAGVVTLGYLTYKGYKSFSSDSISLNEQQQGKLVEALRKADVLARTKAFEGNAVFSITTPDQLVTEQHFTTADGLPKRVVALLNDHVKFATLVNKTTYLMDHQNGRTQPETVAIYKSAKSLDDAVLAQLPVVSAK